MLVSSFSRGQKMNVVDAYALELKKLEILQEKLAAVEKQAREMGQEQLAEEVFHAGREVKELRESMETGQTIQKHFSQDRLFNDP